MKLIFLTLSALLYVLSYSPYNYKILIFVSLIILIITIESLSSKKKALYLLYYAFVFHLIGVSWLSQSLFNYGALDYLGSLFVTLIFILIISLPYSLVGLFHKSVVNNKFSNINLFALLFVVVEFIKSSIFGGFPWLLMGHSQNETIFNIIYPTFGSYAVTYFIILISAIIAKGYLLKAKSYLFHILFFILIYYSVPMYTSDKESSHNEKISFTIYQPNIYPEDSYNSAKHSDIQKKYINFLNQKKSSDLIILPETIVPYELLKDNPLYKKIKDITNKDRTIITGLFTRDDEKIFNSMVFFSENLEVYNKRKLVPFGEYTPWYNTFIKLAQSLDVPLSNLSHGQDNQQDILFKGIRLIPVICFESTFPNLVNSSNNRELIINISNDSWFGNSLAPHQHLQISQIRALEFNRFILRATNTGISAVINNNGKVINYIPNNTEGTITGTVSINNNRTIYSQYGDIGILMLLFLSLLSKVLTRRKSK